MQEQPNFVSCLTVVVGRIQVNVPCPAQAKATIATDPMLKHLETPVPRSFIGCANCVAQLTDTKMKKLSAIVADCRVINLPDNNSRRLHMTNLMNKHGISFSFSEGSTGQSHALNCARAHLAALVSLKTLPALVLEDDVSTLTEDLTIPEIPKDADVVYLGVSPFGCFPWTRRYVQRFGHRAHYNLALASTENSDWLRLHTVAGAIAILYLSPAGLVAWRNSMRAAIKRSKPFDVFTAYKMTSLNVYAPHRPVFYEEPSLQRPLKHVTPEQRLRWTTTPLSPVKEGTIVTMPTNGGAMRARAEVCGDNRLAWSLLQ
ncbi:hypothetical protein [Ruegeria atlantica]|uniref:Glycosyltransferase family 25 (LPS biosynthesis protein) n=1 Tax=Ruegeria atlantica TaxID=81569 RepID=A0A0P1ENJ9_9RHOB|nr:hypothetical protein [Ruegeria atlantica]CUH44953.1 hypothetical protein RUM4293_03862 [Ruegeria atlantica]